MQASSPGTFKGVTIAFAALLAAAAFVVAGCSAVNAVINPTNPTNPTQTTVAVPVSITDAPSDQVVAASLTLDSVVLTNATGKTTSILTSPLTFEATHLDAVQEPLFTPVIPEDTYTSVALTYSNAQVAYIDPTTKKLVLATATLANTGQTIVFPTPLVIDKTMTSLLIDYLVANSVSISGTTVTVTPAFHVAPAPIPAQPTNGTNGLQCGIKGMVTALGTNTFTLTNAQGSSLVIAVNANTQYQGLSGFSALKVDALVEVDVVTQSDGSLLAVRVEEQAPPATASELLVGPVTAVTGSPATSFTMLVRQQIGGPTSVASTAITVSITGSTQFLLPGRFSNVTAADPFAANFSASTLFAGQVVGVATTGVSNGAATAAIVALSPQTVGGTITSITLPMNNVVPNWVKTVIALNSGSWLATLTGQSSVTVYTLIGCPTNENCFLQTINNMPPAVGDTIRFNGFLFENSGSLVMVALIQADGPGTPIAPPQ
jgi:hypothetical protein